MWKIEEHISYSSNNEGQKEYSSLRDYGELQNNSKLINAMESTNNRSTMNREKLQ